MKTNFLFPNRLRALGWILLVPALVLGYLVIFKDFAFEFLNVKALALLPSTLLGESSGGLWMLVDDNFTAEAVAILFIVGAFLVAFSKEKKEDEYIAKIRLESLLWATYVTFGIQIFCLVFFYDVTFLWAMIVNMFTLLIVFIVRYYYVIYRSKFQRDEE